GRTARVFAKRGSIAFRLRTKGAVMAATRTAIRTCPLCEATCGLELTLDGRELIRVRGDREDVFSHGYVCPKGLALVDLENDPDVIKRPLVRDASGTHR